MRKNSPLWRRRGHLFNTSERMPQNIDRLLLMASLLLNVWFSFTQIASLALDQKFLWI